MQALLVQACPIVQSCDKDCLESSNLWLQKIGPSQDIVEGFGEERPPRMETVSGWSTEQEKRRNSVRCANIKFVLLHLHVKQNTDADDDDGDDEAFISPSLLWYKYMKNNIL
ncbi:hypothetical protein ACF0H5_010333 [Mactra antiquata]